MIVIIFIVNEYFQIDVFLLLRLWFILLVLLYIMCYKIENLSI